jgi:hypothetical protein
MVMWFKSGVSVHVMPLIFKTENFLTALITSSGCGSQVASSIQVILQSTVIRRGAHPDSDVVYVRCISAHDALELHDKEFPNRLVHAVWLWIGGGIID